MKEAIEHKYLLIGIGNYGRQDDGLGWEFLDILISNKPENAVCEYRFQLQIEDAELLDNFDTVIFIDASKKKLKNGFEWSVCKSSQKYSFSTHALKPETILYLSENLYGHEPNAYILAIEGHEWELQNGLTKKAKKNLEKAYYFLMEEIFCVTKV
jgi:hydrogenase maturation protease